ncbi:Uncharacterized protein Fot_24510 [Forsythia ovata]|uniref:Endoplasmic reticulum vesicle transporter C-terminal domain-containing protein n=1 Tax=Forsythia ovata TaxID=205694 RepID=A0ABD1U6G0_9LAMI
MDPKMPPLAIEGSKGVFILFPTLQIFEGSSHVNVSHIIHNLSFGPEYPGIHNPLNGTMRILRGASGTFKYYIKIFSLADIEMEKEFDVDCRCDDQDLSSRDLTPYRYSSILSALGGPEPS